MHLWSRDFLMQFNDWLSRSYVILTLLRLLLSKAQGRKAFRQPFKPCHVGIHWIALAECSQVSNMCQGFNHFSVFLHHFVLAKLATSSIRVNCSIPATFALESNGKETRNPFGWLDSDVTNISAD